MKKESGRQKFDSKKALYTKNPVYIYGLLDKYTVKVAKFVYNLGFTADLVSIINLILGLSAIAIMLFLKSYTGLVLAAILIIIRNLGDTIDGKIARGSGVKSTYGGFLDIVSDWIFFHPAFFIALGFLTGNIAIGFLCVTGYMSREFARRVFERKYGVHISKTKELKGISKITSIVKRYDLATVFFFSPILLLLNQPALIIYIVAVIEYALLFGELGFDFYCFFKKQRSIGKQV